MFRPPAQKGAAKSGAWPLPRGLLDGNPLDFHLTGGQVSDTTQLEISFELGPDITPRVAITDKGYDSKANRAAARKKGIVPFIPRKAESKERGRFFPKKLYKLRARVE